MCDSLSGGGAKVRVLGGRIPCHKALRTDCEHVVETDVRPHHGLILLRNGEPSTIPRRVYLCRMYRIPLIVLLSISLGASAQVTDTLGWQRFHEGTPTTYLSPNGGYAFGNNGYGDKVKAQSYSHTESYVLRGALLRFSGVSYTSGNPESKIRVTVYLNNGRGLGLFGFADGIAPDSVLAIKDVPVASLPSNSNPFFVDLSDSALAVFSRISIGIDLTYLAAGDTVGILSTTDGEGGERQEAWELDGSDIWAAVVSPLSWALDVDFAIFPLVDVNDPASVDFQAATASLWPNPTADRLNISVSATGIWQMTVLNALGQVVMHDSFTGNQHPVDVTRLASGLHIIRLQRGQEIVSTRFLKQ